MRTLLVLASASLSLLGVSCAQELEYHTPDRAPVTPTDEPVRDATTPIMQEGPHRPGSDAGVLGPAVTLPEASVQDAGPRDAAADADARVDARVDAATDARADADANEPDADADADTAPPWIMPTVRPCSEISTRPRMTQMVRLSLSPSLKSVRPAVICLTVTFLASACRFSRFIPSSGVRVLSSSTLTSRASDDMRKC